MFNQGDVYEHDNQRRTHVSKSLMKAAKLILCWSVISLAGTAVYAADDAIEDVIKVEVTGTLQTGLMAIGGETTGTVITSNDVTWELDLRKSPKLQAMVSQLNGKKVTVVGRYQRRRGLEIPQREIVTVTALNLTHTKQSSNK